MKTLITLLIVFVGFACAEPFQVGTLRYGPSVRNPGLNTVYVDNDSDHVWTFSQIVVELYCCEIGINLDDIAPHSTAGDAVGIEPSFAPDFVSFTALLFPYFGVVTVGTETRQLIPPSLAAGYMITINGEIEGPIHVDVRPTPEPGTAIALVGLGLLCWIGLQKNDSTNKTLFRQVLRDSLKARCSKTAAKISRSSSSSSRQ